MKTLTKMTITAITLLTIGLTEASTCQWDKNDSSKLHSLYQRGTNSERNNYIRWRRAQINVCNGSPLSVTQILELHYDNDVELSRVDGDRY